MHRAIGLLLVLLLVPARTQAWGFDAHKYVTGRAIELLPSELRPFFEKHRIFLVEHSIDPDLWRNAGFADEPPRHYLDLDAYGAYPFAALPRDYEGAVQKFGRDTVAKNGLLPWRADEMYRELVAAFEGLGKGSRYAPEDIKFFSAVLAHYLADAHVPLHAVLNHDGQLTNQFGVHGRFESELFARYRRVLSVQPRAPAPVRDVRGLVFDTLLRSFTFSDDVLNADRQAIEGRHVYDDPYFRLFFREVRPVLEGRLAESARAIAGAIIGAWEEAGKPAVPLTPPKIIQKVREAR
ncbi:MAG: hypothetical protein HYX76_05040 [Acidobacteria bacterium]|nr:hypothetical protein [Acidobacteriota bacterium]